MNPNHELGQRILAHMATTGGSYTTVAEAVGVSRNRIFRAVHAGEPKPDSDKVYEIARFTVPELRALCAVIGCSLADLDASKPTNTWGDVEKAMDALPLEGEGREILLDVARAAYRAAMVLSR